MFLVTIDTVFEDRKANPILKEMFAIIDNRRKNPLKQIFPIAARPNGYIPCVRHHIIPKSWFYWNHWPIDNTSYNIVNVTVVEHLQLHILLRDYFKQQGDIRMEEAMAGAVSGIYNQNKEDKAIIDYVNLDIQKLSETLNWVYEKRSRIMHEKLIGTKYVNNGEIQLRIKQDEPIPEGFVPGCLNVFANLKWIHKGEDELRIQLGQPLPFGYEIGRAPSKRALLRKNAPSWGSQCLGKVWFNNGQTQIKLSPSDKVPDGFVKGRLPDNKFFITNGIETRKIPNGQPIPEGWRTGQATKGMICVNNGKISMRVFPDKIPSGFSKGRIGSCVKDRIAVSNDTTHHYMMVKLSELDTAIAAGYVRGNHIKAWLREGYIKVPGYKNKGKFIKPE